MTNIEQLEETILSLGTSTSEHKYTLTELSRRIGNKNISEELKRVVKLSELLISHCGYFIEKYYNDNGGLNYAVTRDASVDAMAEDINNEPI